MSNAEETVTAYVEYWWDCPSCGVTNDERDVDPSGEDVTCEDCGDIFYCNGS